MSGEPHRFPQRGGAYRTAAPRSPAGDSRFGSGSSGDSWYRREMRDPAEFVRMARPDRNPSGSEQWTQGARTAATSATRTAISGVRSDQEPAERVKARPSGPSPERGCGHHQAIVPPRNVGSWSPAGQPNGAEGSLVHMFVARLPGAGVAGSRGPVLAVSVEGEQPSRGPRRQLTGRAHRVRRQRRPRVARGPVGAGGLRPCGAPAVAPGAEPAGDDNGAGPECLDHIDECAPGRTAQHSSDRRPGRTGTARRRRTRWRCPGRFGYRWPTATRRAGRDRSSPRWTRRSRVLPGTQRSAACARSRWWDRSSPRR